MLNFILGGGASNGVVGAKGGAAGGGAGGGAGGAAGSLADQYANGLWVQALGHTREGIGDPADAGYPLKTNPTAGVAGRLWRWDPWVQASLLDTELISGLQITVPATHAADMSLCCGTTTLLTLTRPPDSVFQAQVADVISYAVLREDRSAEILAQIDGQWPFWAAILPVPLAELPYTQMLMAATTRLCVAIELQFKHHLACRRPIEWSAQVQPMITTPGHGSFPMGHATQIVAVARVLLALLPRMGLTVTPSLRTQIGRLALRMSENRIVAGVHFPIDLVAGLLLGGVLGDWVAARMTAGPAVQLADPLVPGAAWSALPVPTADDIWSTTPLGLSMVPATPAPTVPPAPLLAELLAKCQDEWTRTL